METGTNGETPATSELDLSFILQGILWLSLSWMVSTFSHVLSLLLLWVSEDAVLDELMKRLFCFACWWRCVWMCLRLSEKDNAMRWRNNLDLQLPSLICSFQERVACFVELDLLYCLCYYDSHGIRGNWLRFFFRHFFITVRDCCPWTVDTACRLA